MGNVVRQVITTESRVAFVVVDPSAGVAFTYEMTWDKFEEFVRTHGEQLPAGQLPRKLSNYLRDGMESEG